MRGRVVGVVVAAYRQGGDGTALEGLNLAVRWERASAFVKKHVP